MTPEAGGAPGQRAPTYPKGLPMPLDKTRIPTPDEAARARAEFPPETGPDYEDYISRFVARRKAGDTGKWEDGADLEALFDGQTPPAPGRPPRIDPSITLEDVAREAQIDRRRLGERLKTHQFYPPSKRRFDPDAVSWSHYNAARVKSDEDLERALEALAWAETRHKSKESMIRWMTGQWEASVFHRSELTPRQLDRLEIPQAEEWIGLTAWRPDVIPERTP
jgi:hypothetical protein